MSDTNSLIHPTVIAEFEKNLGTLYYFSKIVQNSKSDFSADERLIASSAYNAAKGFLEQVPCIHVDYEDIDYATRKHRIVLS